MKYTAGYLLPPELRAHFDSMLSDFDIAKQRWDLHVCQARCEGYIAALFHLGLLIPDHYHELLDLVSAAFDERLHALNCQSAKGCA